MSKRPTKPAASDWSNTGVNPIALRPAQSAALKVRFGVDDPSASHWRVEAQNTVNSPNNYILIGPDVWKETSENPEFIEDKTLLGAWTEQAEREGLHIHTGRWNIEGKPVAILIDFTPFFNLQHNYLIQRL